jgi:hypothetical protein
VGYSWEDKWTFIKVKIIATNILCKVMNDEVYSRELLIEDLKNSFEGWMRRSRGYRFKKGTRSFHSTGIRLFKRMESDLVPLRLFPLLKCLIRKIKSLDFFQRMQIRFFSIYALEKLHIDVYEA